MGPRMGRGMTTKVAVVSDIHGNIRALEAVLSDIADRGIISIINLGDCAYGPFDPRPVLNRLLELDLPTVSGNEDRILVEAARDRSPSRTAMFCARLLTQEHVDWLARLPLMLNIHNALLFHGTPVDDMQYLLTAVDESGACPHDQREVEVLLSGWAQSLILCGHDHTPRVMKLNHGQTVINPGSVGCPAYSDNVPYLHAIENGSPDARYAVVDVQDERVTAELVSVLYNWPAAAQEAEINGFPDWAHWIATGHAS
jgi:predicted phosphodiesterase